jgi:pyridoxine 5-phosphate synthase
VTLLSVNVNKIALLRNSRGADQPSVIGMAQEAIDAGAHGITVHPRPDGRHIRKHDVYDLKSMLQVEFNIEGYPSPEFIDMVLDVRPDQCTLVPDDPGQLTSDHGWDLARDGERVAPLIEQLTEAGVRVSLFMDPVAENMALAKRAGADRVELYTESYAQAHATGDFAAVLAEFQAAAAAATAAGLGVNAGHDLSQANLGDLLRAIPQIAEVSIGHALVCEALRDGWTPTIQNYLRVIESARA